MSASDTRPGSYAVVHGKRTTRLYAENQAVMDRLLGLHVVARLPSASVRSETDLQMMRRALREERWADALGGWISVTGNAVDVFDSAPDVFDSSSKIWLEDDLPSALVQSLLADTPLFKSK